MQSSARIATACEPRSQSKICQFCSFQTLSVTGALACNVIRCRRLTTANRARLSAQLSFFQRLESSGTSARRSRTGNNLYYLLVGELSTNIRLENFLYLYYTLISTCYTGAIAGRKKCIMWLLSLCFCLMSSRKVMRCFPIGGLHWVVLPVQRRHHTSYFDGIAAYKQLGTCDAHGAFVLVDY